MAARGQFTPSRLPRAVPHAAAQRRVLDHAPADLERHARDVPAAPSSSTSSIAGHGIQIQWLGTFGKLNGYWSGGTRYDARPTRCSTRRCRWPPSGPAASPGSTCSRSTASARRGSARSPRAPACRRWPAPPRGSAARPTCSRSLHARARHLRDLAAAGRAHPRRRRRPLPAVLRAAGAEDPQRLHPVARRALRLRLADRRPARRSRSSRPATRGAVRRCATFDTGAWSLYSPRLVLLRVRPRLPHAAARLPQPAVLAHGGGRVLRRGAALHRLSDDPAGHPGAARHAQPKKSASCASSSPRSRA